MKYKLTTKTGEQVFWGSQDGHFIFIIEQPGIPVAIDTETELGYEDIAELKMSAEIVLNQKLYWKENNNQQSTINNQMKTIEELVGQRVIIITEGPRQHLTVLGTLMDYGNDLLAVVIARTAECDSAVYFERKDIAQITHSQSNLPLIILTQ